MTSSRKINISKGKYIVVDSDDYNDLCKNKWTYVKRGKSYSALRTYNGKKQYVYNVIFGKKDGFEIDHINGLPWDNRKSNLRFVTKSQNQMNRPPEGGVSKYRGVSCLNDGRKKKWIARVNANKKLVYQKKFYSEVTAALAYNKYAKLHHGEYAKLNILTGGGL